MPRPLPPHGGPGEVQEIPHNPAADALALGLFENIRRGIHAVDMLAGLGKDRALADNKETFETGEEPLQLNVQMKGLVKFAYERDLASVEVDGIADVRVLGEATSKWTALHVAAQAGNADAAGTLLGAEGDTTSRGNGAFAPLHEAARFGHANVIASLSTFGAQMDPRGSQGLTPLHVACRHGHANAVAALCDAGAGGWDCLGPDREQHHELSKDVYGETTLDVCKRFKHRPCAQELRGHQVRVLCEMAHHAAVAAKEDVERTLASVPNFERGEELLEEAEAGLLRRLMAFEPVFSVAAVPEAERLRLEEEAEVLGEDHPPPDGKILQKLFERATRRFRLALALEP